MGVQGFLGKSGRFLSINKRKPDARQTGVTLRQRRANLSTAKRTDETLFHRTPAGGRRRAETQVETAPRLRLWLPRASAVTPSPAWTSLRPSPCPNAFQRGAAGGEIYSSM